MSETAYNQDANGVELRSARKKIVAPRHEDDEYIVVWLVDPTTGQQSYNYVDAITALQCDRLAHAMRETSPDKFIMSRAKDWGFDKYCREAVQAGYAMWPAQGYLIGKLQELGILDEITTPVAAPQMIDAPQAPQSFPPYDTPAPEPVVQFADQATELILSDDGNFAWDGAQWVPYVPDTAPAPPPVPEPEPVVVAPVVPEPQAQVIPFPPAPPIPTMPVAPEAPVAVPPQVPAMQVPQVPLPPAPPPPGMPAAPVVEETVSAPPIPPMPPVPPVPPVAAPTPPPLPGMPT